MDTLEAMRVFVAVVERNGFSAAAQALDMSTAGVTRQVAALEKRLSTRLLHRTTRRVSPTSTGAAYYAQCVRLLAEFDALEASIGAQALGIRNLLCTSGSHQTLAPFRAAKNVYDLDPVQLLQTYRDLADDGALVGGQGIAGAGPFCLGGTAAPYADPMEFQIMRLAKKVSAGAQFLITQPVFSVERFGTWWEEISRRNLCEKVAIVVGIEPLHSAKQAELLAAKRPQPWIPADIVKRLSSAGDAAAQRAAGVAIAVETIQRLAAFKGLRGFQIVAHDDPSAALEVIEKAALGTN